MFGKKKAVVTRSEPLKCQVPGCSVTCTDPGMMERHVNWAHRDLVTPAREKEAAVLQKQ